MAASDRWIVNDDHRLSVGQLAATTLRRRFDAVWTELRAACDMPDHAEHVHQLRVATRRTLAAFDAFHAVIPAKRRAWFEKRLRRLRRTAGEARDLDVLTDRLAHDAARARSRLVAMLSKQRRKSRAPIRAPGAPVAARAPSARARIMLSLFGICLQCEPRRRVDLRSVEAGVASGQHAKVKVKGVFD